MSIHPLKTVAALLLASGAVVVGLGATSGQEPKPPEKPSTTPETPSRDQSAIDRRFEALEQRIRDLEHRLDEVAPSRRSNTRAYLGPFDPDTLVKIRPRFDNALIVEVFVKTGQVVKKGDPLLILKSADLAAAKNDCRSKFVQWDHDHKVLLAREPMAKNLQITQIVWTDTQNDEKKSRLDFLVARERLTNYGISAEEIDRLLEDLSDDRKPSLGPFKKDDITRLTVVSPIDGVVVQRDVVPGNFYDHADVLFVIAPPKP